jgi:hypothetical protein
MVIEGTKTVTTLQSKSWNRKPLERRKLSKYRYCVERTWTLYLPPKIQLQYIVIRIVKTIFPSINLFDQYCWSDSYLEYIFIYIFGRLDSVCHSFTYVSHNRFFLDKSYQPAGIYFFFFLLNQNQIMAKEILFLNDLIDGWVKFFFVFFDTVGLTDDFFM